MIYFIIPTVLTKSTTFRLSTNFATVFFVSLLHSGNRNCAAYLCRKPSIIPNSAPIIVLMHCTFAARVVLSLHCYSLWLFRYIFSTSNGFAVVTQMLVHAGSVLVRQTEHDSVATTKRELSVMLLWQYWKCLRNHGDGVIAPANTGKARW